MEKIAQVYRTNNYELFKQLDGNRDVGNRASKIRKKIQQVGYILSPIIVNEKMEIIDGAGRYNALKSMGLPIDYIIVEGLTLKHCIAMNMSQTNWTTLDFIHSYAVQGNENYIRFSETLAKFHLTVTLLSSILFDSEGGKLYGPIIEGHLNYDADKQKEIESIAQKCNECRDVISKIGGKIQSTYRATAYIFRNYPIDALDFAETIQRNLERTSPVGTFEHALTVLESAYNYRKRAKYYFHHDYIVKRTEIDKNSRKRRKEEKEC